MAVYINYSMWTVTGTLHLAIRALTFSYSSITGPHENNFAAGVFNSILQAIRAVTLHVLTCMAYLWCVGSGGLVIMTVALYEVCVVCGVGWVGMLGLHGAV